MREDNVDIRLAFPSPRFDGFHSRLVHRARTPSATGFASGFRDGSSNTAMERGSRYSTTGIARASGVRVVFRPTGRRSSGKTTGTGYRLPESTPLIRVIDCGTTNEYTPSAGDERLMVDSSHDAQTHTGRLELVDEAGELLRASDPIADNGGNSLSIFHRRGDITPRGNIPVEVDFERALSNTNTS